MKKPQAGFTIVELLVVIVVIGILAAITIVSYTSIQDRARDAQRQSDLSTIAKALQLYYLDHGDYVEAGSGCGRSGDGNGFFNASNGSTYPRSIMDCLLPYTGGKELIDPSGRTEGTGHIYMKYSCGQGTYLYAYLASRPQTSTDTDGTCHSAADTSYGMNYYVKVD